MACPCGEYEYVESTSKTLADVMSCEWKFDYTFFSDSSLPVDHRNHLNEIIHEKLTGGPLYRERSSTPNEKGLYLNEH